MPGRKYEAQSGYRYGFNGKEKDKDLNSLTAYDYGFRIYNPAIAKFLSVDPLMNSYPWYTPYQFAGNNPIWAIDVDGLEEKKVDEEGKGSSNPNEEAEKGGAVKSMQDVELVAIKKQKGFWGWCKRAARNTGRFIGNEVIPRVGGALKAAAGGAIMAVGAATAEIGIGIPVFAFGADYGGSGLAQVWHGKSQRTVTEQVLIDHGIKEDDAQLGVDIIAAPLSMSGLSRQATGTTLRVSTTTQVEANVVKAEATALKPADEAALLVKTQQANKGFNTTAFADEIISLNKATDGGGVLLNGTPSSAINSAMYYQTAAEQGAAIFRSISAGHMFINGNKRTAVAVFQSFARQHGLNTVSEQQMMNVATQVATGELSDVLQISKLLIK